MSSYIMLEIDTTQPNIEIYAPSYTTTDIVNEITINSDEALSDYQEIYAIDGNGVRHDYTFQKKSGNQLIGYAKFSGCPLGIVTLYARVKDEVDNISNLISKTINIASSVTLLTLDISDRVMDIDISDRGELSGN